eukprot:COSAG02_NODE_5580_length_4215_cov_2.083576_6_plen_84_part_00
MALHVGPYQRWFPVTMLWYMCYHPLQQTTRAELRTPFKVPAEDKQQLSYTRKAYGPGCPVPYALCVLVEGIENRIKYRIQTIY